MIFPGLAFFISYALAFPFLIGGLRNDSVAFVTLASAYMFVPALCVLIVKKLYLKERLANDLMISFRLNRWFLVAWLLMPVLSMLAFGISLLFPDVTYTPDMGGYFSRFASKMSPQQIEAAKESLRAFPLPPLLFSALQGMLAGVSINALFAFGEELAWRGFLLKSFTKMRFFKASFLIGCIWGLWHAPLILMGHNYPEHPRIGVLMMIAWCILLSPIFVYITIKAKSVIASSIMHGTLNGTAGLSILLIAGGNDLTTGITGFSGIIALVFANLFLFIYDRFISGENIMMDHLQ